MSLERAVDEAQVRGLLDGAAVRDRPPAHPGARRLLAALDGAGGAPSDSALERAMERLIRDAGLPRAQRHLVIAGHRADFASPTQRVIVETDGWGAHGNRLAFERDRRRDQAHVLAGWTVIRVTWRQLTERPFELAARLAALLSRPASRRARAR